MRKKLYLLSLVVFSKCVLYAQFSGVYAPANWSTTRNTGTGGTVNTSGAPNSIVITGSDLNTGTMRDINFTIAANATGAWSFSWSYSTSDAPSTDPAYVLKNGTPTLLTVGGAQNQSGVFNGTADVGDVIGFRVRAEDDCCGTGILTVSSFSAPAGVLPIKLMAFTASPDKHGVQLRWTTSWEIENNRFDIEKSTDGSNFAIIGAVKSLGNSTQIQNYSFIDPAPGAADNYYRLRHFDNDNKTYVSAIVVCSFKPGIANTIYPNPSSNTVYLNLANTGAFSTETVQLFNANFGLLETRLIKLRTAGGNKVSWDISRLPVGTYFFKLEKAGKVMRLIKK